MTKLAFFPCLFLFIFIAGCGGSNNAKRFSDKEPVLLKTITSNTGDIKIYKKQVFTQHKTKNDTYLTSTYRFYVKNNSSQTWCVKISLKKQKSNSIKIWVRGKHYLYYREPRIIFTNKTVRYAMILKLLANKKVNFQVSHRLPTDKELRWKKCRSRS